MGFGLLRSKIFGGFRGCGLLDLDFGFEVVNIWVEFQGLDLVVVEIL